MYYFSCSSQNPYWHISHIPLQILQQSLLDPISQYVHNLISSHYLSCYHLAHSSSVSWTTMITSLLVSLLLECLSLQKYSLTLYSKSALKTRVTSVGQIMLTLCLSYSLTLWSGLLLIPKHLNAPVLLHRLLSFWIALIPSHLTAPA